MVLGGQPPGRVGRRRFFSKSRPSGRLFSLQVCPVFGRYSGLVREEDLETGVEAVRVLSDVIGPRPSASVEEAAAASYVSGLLRDMGLEPSTELFRSSRSFGPSYMLAFGLAAAAGLFKRRPLRYVTGAVAAGLGLADSRFSRFGASALTKWRTSRNVFATLEPSSVPERTVCIVSHLDSSRSGLMFHPSVTPVLGKVVAAAGTSLILQAMDPLIGRGPGRWLIWKARMFCAIAFGVILERELRGKNVSGTNDNASGVGACLALAARFSREPLRHTRLVLLATGSEESGVYGMSEFLRSHDTEGWCFLNFDGVSAEASLRVLSKEGGPLGSANADGELLELSARVGERRPELEAVPLKHGSGLPYDATPVMAAGGRAMTIVNQDGAIPDYHWPTDRFDRFSTPSFERAVNFAEQLLLEIDAD